MDRDGGRNIMNALLKFFFVIIVVSLPIPCDAGPDLSDEDATGIIKAHFGYPAVVPTQTTFKEKSRKMLDYTAAVAGLCVKNYAAALKQTEELRILLSSKEVEG